MLNIKSVKVKTVNFISEDGWKIRPAGGVTGEAFYACHGQEKLFLKRNSSPFLAVLSAEGIVPKLVWTRRLENGDTITAQEWIQGRKLEPHDMGREPVAKLLNKIHRSQALLKMLYRIGKTPSKPHMLIRQLEGLLDEQFLNNPLIQRTLRYLRNHIHRVEWNSWAVCHGDVNHNNWLLTKDNDLYLIDWDNALIGDPAIDIGPLLYWYIPEEDWDEWLRNYGVTPDQTLKFRLHWYTIYQTLYSIHFYYENGNRKESKFWYDYLANFF